jgi:hypothetical protein
MPYGIWSFKDEVLCDISPLDDCSVPLGQPYLWKHHALYDFIPRSVIINLGIKLYKILEVAPPTVVSFTSAKQCRKVISQTGKFVFFTILSQGEQKVTATSMDSIQGLSTQQK